MSKDIIDKREVDSNGFVEIFDNPISMVGVYPYLGSMIGGKDPSKIYYVLRSEEELSKPETIASLKLMPFVDEHEMIGNGETPAEKKGIHGVIGERVYFDKNGNQGAGIYSNLKIHSTSLLEKIDNPDESKRIKDISAGYRADHEFTPGTFNGIHYDATQKNIIFNHVALVPNGRMGSNVAVLDNQDISLTNPLYHQESKMPSHIDKLREIHRALGEFLGEESAEPENAVTDEEESEVEKEPETKAEEDEPMKEEKKEEVMDSALVEQIINEKVAKALGNVGKRDELYEKLKPHTGVMDSAHEMTLDQLAAYGIEKLGIECPKGQEAAALQGFFAGLTKNNVQDGQEFIDQAYKTTKPSLARYQ